MPPFEPRRRGGCDQEGANDSAREGTTETGEPTPRSAASTTQLVERVVPNALDVGPRSAPFNALGTTRSTMKSNGRYAIKRALSAG